MDCSAVPAALDASDRPTQRIRTACVMGNNPNIFIQVDTDGTIVCYDYQGSVVAFTYAQFNLTYTVA